LGFDDGVDEGKGEGVLLHFHGVEVVKGELGDALNADSELAPEVSLLGLEVNLLLNKGSGENVVTDRNVVDKNTF
jgi:hypothetical protein